MVEQVGVSHGPISRDDIFVGGKENKLLSSTVDALRLRKPVGTLCVDPEPLSKPSRCGHAPCNSEECFLRIDPVDNGRDSFRTRIQKASLRGGNRSGSAVDIWDSGDSLFSQPTGQRSVVRKSEHGSILAGLLTAFRSLFENSKLRSVGEPELDCHAWNDLQNTREHPVGGPRSNDRCLSDDPDEAPISRVYDGGTLGGFDVRPGQVHFRL